MAMGSNRTTYVQCPFFRYEDGHSRVVCEGFVDGSSLALTFGKKKDYQIQMDVFCCQHYKKCEVYRMLMEKYGD